MEVKFQDSKAVSVEFPKRKSRNKTEENWNVSQKQNIFLEKQGVRVDGSNGDVVVDYKISPYLKQKIVSGELNLNGIFFPEQTDPEIESMLEVSERIKLNGKTFRQASPIELIQAGILKL
jgi:glutamine cyclotransferase